jgi:hypothetical protein
MWLSMVRRNIGILLHTKIKHNIVMSGDDGTRAKQDDRTQ